MKQMIADGVRVQTIITSPPYYGLRDYGNVGQIGLERDPMRYLARMRSVFRLCWDLLEKDGTVWLNMGDSYHTRSQSGGIGRNSTINGQGSQLASRDARNAHKRKNKLRGIKPKDMYGMPWMLALLLRQDGWYLRSDIIWHKKNPMPESTTDRPTKSHEYIFLLSKSPTYYYDSDAIREPCSEGTHARMAQNVADQHGSLRANGGSDRPMKAGGRPQKKVSGWDNGPGNHSTVAHAGRKHSSHTKFGAKNNDSFDAAMKVMPESRNKRTVWTLATEAFEEAHFATFPVELIEPCVLAGSAPGEIVFDPFMGSGTTAQVATSLGRNFIGCELNPDYVKMHKLRATTIGFQF